MGIESLINKIACMICLEYYIQKSGIVNALNSLGNLWEEIEKDCYIVFPYLNKGFNETIAQDVVDECVEWISYKRLDGLCKFDREQEVKKLSAAIVGILDDYNEIFRLSAATV